MGIEEDWVCEGCRRPEIHKSCPAYGTEFYMTGVPYTEETQDKVEFGRSQGYDTIDQFYFDVERILYNERRKQKDQRTGVRS